MMTVAEATGKLRFVEGQGAPELAPTTITDGVGHCMPHKEYSTGSLSHHIESTIQDRVLQNSVVDTHSNSTCWQHVGAYFVPLIARTSLLGSDVFL